MHWPQRYPPFKLASTFGALQVPGLTPDLLILDMAAERATPSQVPAELAEEPVALAVPELPFA